MFMTITHTDQVYETLARVSYPHTTFELVHNEDGFAIRATKACPDLLTNGETTFDVVREAKLRYDEETGVVTSDDVLTTAMRAVLCIEVHEVSELFLIDNERKFNEHDDGRPECMADVHAAVREASLEVPR